MLLRDLDRERIINIARQTLPPGEVWACVGHMDDSAQDVSDLDLVVRGENLTAVDVDKFSAFKDALNEFNASMLIQVFDWARIPDKFRDEILKCYEVLTVIGEEDSVTSSPERWKRILLGDIVTLSGGKRLPKGKMLSKVVNKHPYIRITDFDSHRINLSNIEYVDDDTQLEISRYTVNAGDLIMSIVGTIGLCAIVPKSLDNANLTENCVKILFDNAKNSSKFLYYQLISGNVQHQIQRLNVGSTQPKLPLYNIKKISISLPPPKEQKSIAKILSNLDDKIDLLHRQNKILENMAETLFDYKIVNGDDSEKEEVKLSDIYNFERGTEPGRSHYKTSANSADIRFIRVGDMLNAVGNTYVDSELLPITCEEKDLLVSFDGTVGRVAFGIKGGYSSGIRKITSHDPVYNNFGLKYLLFKSKKIQSIIKEHATGTVILHASSAIDYLSFKLPSRAILAKFQTRTDPLFNKIFDNLSQIRLLSVMRDTLLPKLMSGAIRVKQPIRAKT